MRRKDREIKNITELLDIITQCKVCRVGMIDTQGLYIVPMNFGYIYKSGKLTLYFHSAKEGRKITALKENESVCFEMDCDHKLLTAEAPCGYGYSFKSIIGNGRASFIETLDEKIQALQTLMKHQSGQDFHFSETMSKQVSLFKIDVETFSGKAHEHTKAKYGYLRHTPPV